MAEPLILDWWTWASRPKVKAECWKPATDGEGIPYVQLRGSEKVPDSRR